MRVAATGLKLCSILMTLFIAIQVNAQPSAAAIALIEELQLRSADTPIREHPSWNPQRVVVSLPTFLSSQLPTFEADLKKVAGETDLVFDRSDNFTLAKDTLTTADAIIGLCTQQTLGNADDTLLWLQNYFVGMDSCVGLSEQQRKSIVFSNTKRLSGPSIAEHTIAMMMSLARNLPHFHQAQQSGNWQPSLARQKNFGEISGKTMLVVGLGGIGSQVALRAHGLGMRVIATRNSSRSGPDYVDYVGLAPELPELAGQADVIVNALPLTASTTGLFDKTFFSAVKPGALFLSVGRGKSTVTADLIEALQNGQLFAAGLDVTDPEPLPASSPLWQMNNVIITPHISAVTPDSLSRTAVLAVENLRRYVAGEALLNIVNIEDGY